MRTLLQMKKVSYLITLFMCGNFCLRSSQAHISFHRRIIIKRTFQRHGALYYYAAVAITNIVIPGQQVTCGQAVRILHCKSFVPGKISCRYTALKRTPNVFCRILRLFASSFARKNQNSLTKQSKKHEQTDFSDTAILWFG